jgi:hypothetical protein
MGEAFGTFHLAEVLPEFIEELRMRIGEHLGCGWGKSTVN